MFCQHGDSIFLGATRMGYDGLIELQEFYRRVGSAVVKLLTTLFMWNAVRVTVDPDQIIWASTDSPPHSSLIPLGWKRPEGRLFVFDPATESATRNLLKTLAIKFFEKRANRLIGFCQVEKSPFAKAKQNPTLT